MFDGVDAQHLTAGGDLDCAADDRYLHLPAPMAASGPVAGPSE